MTDVPLSLPRVIARAGIVADIPPRLDEVEHLALRHSAQTLKEAACSISL